MAASVTLIHTVASLVEPFRNLAGELLPQVDVFHVVDESLLTVTRRRGEVTVQTRRRLLSHALSADDLGVSAILVTCSSMGPAVEAIQPFVAARLLRVDDAMADNAISLGRRIAVLGTLSTTMEPTRELIGSHAIEHGVQVSVESVVCEGAFEALASGDTATHDGLVRAALLRLAADNDVIVLAQASMARVLATLGDTALAIPVLTSPRSAMERLALILA